MENATFYDRHGSPIAYIQNGSDIYLFNGRPVAYVHDESVYSYNGTHLGRYENGWIRDNTGRCVFFTENASGSGPMKPMKHMKPMKSVKYAKPSKSARQAKPARPVNYLNWSSLSGYEFFDQ